MIHRAALALCPADWKPCGEPPKRGHAETETSLAVQKVFPFHAQPNFLSQLYRQPFPSAGFHRLFTPLYSLYRSTYKNTRSRTSVKAKGPTP